MWRKHVILILMILAVLLRPLASYAQKNHEVKKIYKSFFNFQKSVIKENGLQASIWVNQDTKDFYRDVLKVSIGADSTDVDNSELLKKTLILTFRHLIPYEDIVTMGGDALFVYSVDERVLEKKYIERGKLDSISINENVATAKFYSANRVRPFNLVFTKEYGTWKIDLTDTYLVSCFGADLLLAEARKKENAYILMKLSTASGREPQASIWKPLINFD